MKNLTSEAIYIQNREFLYICGRLNLNMNNEKIIFVNHYQMKNLTSEAILYSESRIPAKMIS